MTVIQRKSWSLCNSKEYKVTFEWIHWYTISWNVTCNVWHPGKHCIMTCPDGYAFTLRWRHNGRECVSNHQPHDRLLNRLFRRRSKKRSKFRVTGLCAGNSPVTGEFPTQMASSAAKSSSWWRHHASGSLYCQSLACTQPNTSELKLLLH